MLPLKEATSAKHVQAEKMPFNKRMFNGELSKDEYLVYLQQQYQVFKAIEAIGLPSKVLARVPSLQEDIDELLNAGCTNDEVLKSTSKYVSHINGLSYDEVLPHIYLNYLALLYGGQYLKKKVPSSGKFYKFDFVKEAMQSVRNIQKDEWADEANKGFDFLIEMFDELESFTQNKLIK